MRLYFVAGEASGDARGAELMNSLRAIEPTVEFYGRGGAQMRHLAGEAFHEWTDRAGVIGFIDVVKNYRYFQRQFAETLREIAALRPDAVVLIDYPGFNLRLARALKERPESPRLLYYISPQVWAWHRSRIPKMARVVDLMMCIFPFEKELYERSGLHTVFVGHPMLDSLAAKKIAGPRDEQLVGLFPGSRKREIERIFPAMLGAAARIAVARPDVRFEAAAASAAMQERMQEIARGMPHIACTISLRNSHELMQRAAAGMVASGTATMEAAFFGLPFCVIYRAAWLTFAIGRRVVQVPFLGMPNILAGREVVREFLQEDATPDRIGDHMLGLLNDHAARETLVTNLAGVIAQLGAPGASRRAAEAIIEAVRGRTTAP